MNYTGALIDKEKKEGDSSSSWKLYVPLIYAGKDKSWIGLSAPACLELPVPTNGWQGKAYFGLHSPWQLSFLFLSSRPVPGSLSSLLHLHNRQRQPMPASMPGTLPNPTMPGSSAVLMPVSLLIWLFLQGEKLCSVRFYPSRGESLPGFVKTQCNKLRKLDLLWCFTLEYLWLS